MIRRLSLLILIVVLTGCGDTIVEYQISARSVERFAANAETLAARDDAGSPLAASILAGNQIGAPEGVKVWNLELTLRSIGLNDGDLIALIDGQVPSRDYRTSFAVDQKPFSSPTEQYVHFVSGLLALGDTQGSVLLSVHPQYRTSAEREQHGLHAREPKLIRIVFR